MALKGFGERRMTLTGKKVIELTLVGKYPVDGQTWSYVEPPTPPANGTGSWIFYPDTGQYVFTATFRDEKGQVFGMLKTGRCIAP